MGDSFTCLLTHFVWSTKHREPQIVAEIKPRLHAYMAGILKKLECVPVLINGVEDHVHVFTYRHPTVAESELARVVKSNSSKWMHETYASHPFGWQDGYGAFSVSMSNKEDVRRYVADQERHHKSMSCRQEMEILYRKHEIDFEERFLD